MIEFLSPSAGWPQSPKLVVFEGFDGTGKTVLSRFVAEHYGFARAALSPDMQGIRRLFDRNCDDMTARAAFYAALNIGQQAEIDIGLQRGTGVVLDRYYMSTLVTHDLPEESLAELRPFCAGLRQPDLWFYLDCPFETVLRHTARRWAEGRLSDYDRQVMTPEHHATITRRYKQELPRDTCAIINANGPIEAMKEPVMGFMDPLLTAPEQLADKRTTQGPLWA